MNPRVNHRLIVEQGKPIRIVINAVKQKKNASKSSGFPLSVEIDSCLLLSALPYYMTGLRNSRHFEAQSPKQQWSWLAGDVSPYFASGARNDFEFWLIHGIVCVPCFWFELLVWFWFWFYTNTLEEHSKDNFNCLNSSGTVYSLIWAI